MSEAAARTALKHRIEWTIQPEVIFGFVFCDAGLGAMCRVVCPEGCPEWNEDHEHDFGPSHALVDQGECNAMIWLNSEGALHDLYEGPAAPLVSGLIRVRYDEGYMWDYGLPANANQEPTDE